MKSFKYSCQKYLTPAMNKPVEDGGLSYEQKQAMLNLIVKQELGSWRYEKLTSSKDITNTGEVDYVGIGETLDDLPMTDRQRSICRYKYQQYTIDEISQLLNVSDSTINRELIAIKGIIEANSDNMTATHDTWHKKTGGYDE